MENQTTNTTQKENSLKFKNMKFQANKKLIIPLAILAILALGWYLYPNFIKPKPKAIYEVAVMVRSQTNPDKSEDLRTSLKSGDVLVVQNEGHKWSKTEQVSYLILKMELTEEQKAKLLAPNEKEIDFKDLSEEEQQRIKDEEQRAKDEGRDYEPEPRRETLRARAYRIDLEELEFSKPADLIKGQPFADQIFGWEIVEKKPKVK